MTNKTTQYDIEVLTDYLAGLLDDSEVLTVERRLGDDAMFAQALEDLRSLDHLLDTYKIPACHVALPSRIIARVRRDRITLRIRRWLGPVAAAALVIIGVSIWITSEGGSGNRNRKPTRQVTNPAGVTELAVHNLDFFQNFDVAADLTEVLASEQAGQKISPSQDENWSSIEKQLKLKLRLKSLNEGITLAQAIDCNRRSWQILPVDQRADIRSRALAFLDLPASRQDELLVRYAKFVKMTPDQKRAYRERANWLGKVVQQLTIEQKEHLKSLLPSDRARQLMQLRDELE